MRTRPETRRAIGTFFAALILSLCVLGFAAACAVIEYNMQKTATGEADFGITYTMRAGVPEITDTATGRRLLPKLPDGAKIFIPAPARLIAKIIEGEWEIIRNSEL